MENAIEKSKVMQLNCQRVAVLSDIHSNYYALLACLTDAQNEGADGFVFLGDYVSGLANPTQTMDLVYQTQERYPTFCLRGNRERYMLDHKNGVDIFAPGSNTGSFLFTSNQLRERDFSFFANLPISATVKINDVTMELAHATQKNDRFYFEKGDKKISSIVNEMNEKYLLCGHSHKQYIHKEQGKVIINPGAVGLPHGADFRAQYLLLTVEKDSIICTFRQVPCNIEETIHAQFQSKLVQIGQCWAISDLYGAITGKEYTKDLLTKMYAHKPVNKDTLADEKIWQMYTTFLKMRFSEAEILGFWKKVDKHLQVGSAMVVI